MSGKTCARCGKTVTRLEGNATVGMAGVCGKCISDAFWAATEKCPTCTHPSTHLTHMVQAQLGDAP